MPKALKQLVVIAGVVAISLVFIVSFRPGTNVQVTGGPQCAIEIRGACIPRSDFMAAYRLAAPNIEPEQLKRMGLRRLVIDGLVERWLLLEDAKRLGISAGGDDVTRYVAGNGMARFSLPVAQEDYAFLLSQMSGGQIVGAPYGPARRIPVTDPKTGRFSYKRYQRWVSRGSGKTEKDFKEFQRREMLAARVRSLVGSRVRVSEVEAKRTYAKANETLTVDYLKLEAAFYRDYVLDTSKDARKRWAGENGAAIDEKWKAQSANYMPTCRVTRHLLVRIDEDAPDQAEAKKAAETKLAEARKRIDDGEAFSKVAREMSDDSNSAPDGGHLGCFAAGKLNRPGVAKEIDEVAYKLKKGELSETLSSGQGLHLVLVDKIAEGAAAEAVGRAEITKALFIDKAAAKLASDAAKEIHEAVKGGKTMQDALDAHFAHVLPEKAKEAFEAGQAKDAGKDSAGELDAWTDPTRPQLKTSEPFTAGTAPFGRVMDATATTNMLFALKKPGTVAPELIKLFDGAAVASFKERKAVDDAAWGEARAEYLEGLRRAKQKAAVAAYLRRLRKQYASEIVFKIPLSETSDDKKSSKG